MEQGQDVLLLYTSWWLLQNTQNSHEFQVLLRHQSLNTYTLS